MSGASRAGASGGLGAVPGSGGRCAFNVWAPAAELVEVRLLTPSERVEPLRPAGEGYHAGTLEGAPPGSLYWLRLDGGPDRPDPASRSQPRGVLGPSEIFDPRFTWTDASFTAAPLAGQVFYELHVGTFTKEGTFDAVIPHLGRLRDLGVTTLEIMPVAQFPGERNWGYDGAFPFAVQDSYGGPAGLMRLVDACHGEGLSVCLDVVYNHFGPQGAFQAEFGPYFTGRYATPWGAAVNFDGADSDHVRRYFIESALYFLDALHVDAFRVDAIHAIADSSARPFLQDLTAALHERAASSGRQVIVVAESDANDARVVKPAGEAGLGFDAVWADDFHHALHTVLTGESAGYYADFGGLELLAQAYRRAFVYDGRHSKFRRRRHGSSPEGLPPRRFVVSLQNHDQIGNRARGDRLSAALSFAEQKLAACALLLSPYLPLLFMGQEYGETAPFAYFTSHGDPELAEAVRRGRRAEFVAFGWRAEEIPDPQAVETFERSKLDHEAMERPRLAALAGLHRELLRLRRDEPALRADDGGETEARADEARSCIVLRRRRGSREAAVVLAFGDAAFEAGEVLPAGRWEPVLDTEDPRWLGSGAAVPNGAPAAPAKVFPRSCVVFLDSGVGRGESR